MDGGNACPQCEHAACRGTVRLTVVEIVHFMQYVLPHTFLHYNVNKNGYFVEVNQAPSMTGQMI